LTVCRRFSKSGVRRDRSYQAVSNLCQTHRQRANQLPPISQSAIHPNTNYLFPFLSITSQSRQLIPDCRSASVSSKGILWLPPPKPPPINPTHACPPDPAPPKAKPASPQNAVRHGLTARHPVVRDDEHEAFAALRDGLAAELDPQGALEELAFQQILLAAWNLQRFSRLEAEASTGTLEDFTNPVTAALLDRLSRYQTRAQRAFSKGIAELRILQTNRALRARKLDDEEAAQVPAITSINDLTKQTQPESTVKAMDLAIQMTDLQTDTLVRHAHATFVADLANRKNKAVA
jgi:hypothetical protein